MRACAKLIVIYLMSLERLEGLHSSQITWCAMSGIGTWIFQRGAHDPEVQTIHSALEGLIKAYFSRHPDAYQLAIGPNGIPRPKVFDLTPAYGSVLAHDSVIMGFSLDGEIATALQKQETLVTAFFKIPSHMTVAALFTEDLAAHLDEVSLDNAVYDFLYGLDDQALSDLAVEVSSICVVSVLART